MPDVFPVLGTGQSNNRGRRQGGSPVGELDPRVLVWNNLNPPPKNKPLADTGSAFIPPVLGEKPFDDRGPNNHFGIWFCHRAARELSVSPRLVDIGRGGTSITAWEPEVGFLWNAISAVYAASGLPAAKVALWHQGESDCPAEDGGSGMPPAEYKQRFLAYDTALRSRGYLQHDAPHIVGGLAKPTAANIDQALRELAEENDLIEYASAVDLATDDEVHFLGDDLVRLGYSRYWSAYERYQRNKPMPTYSDVFIATEELPAGTNGGDFNAGDWRIRDINTIRSATDGVVLDNGKITLPAGRWHVSAWASGWKVDRHQVRLFNVTDNEVIAPGSSEFTEAAGAASTKSDVEAVIDIAVPTTVRLEHRCDTTKVLNGRGVSTLAGWGVNGVFALLRAVKIAEAAA